MIASSTSSLPLFNFSVADLPGEMWCGIPGLEKYVQISQFGRVKRLGRKRTTKKGICRYYGDRILKSVLIPRQSFHENAYHFGLICTVAIEGVTHSFNPMRLVYYLFKSNFPLEDIDYQVSVINGDDLDIRPQNLRLTHFPRYTRQYQKYRESHLTVEKKIRFYKNTNFSKAVIARRAFISCYGDDGHRLNIYSNITQASTLTGLAVEAIEKALQHPLVALAGAYWRSGKSHTIDMSIIRTEQIRLFKEQHGTKVTQFDLNGNPIGHFLCIEDAAEAMDIDVDDILLALDIQDRVAGFFFWRSGYLHEKIDGI